MNGVPEIYEAKVKQSAKGAWSCEKLEYSAKEWSSVLAGLDIAMTEMEALIYKHNATDVSEASFSFKFGKAPTAGVKKPKIDQQNEAA